jgi:pimeloyl-ACP methyl ester carboxylesterase
MSRSFFAVLLLTAFAASGAQVSKPTFNKGGGSYTGSVTVTVSSATSGSSIRITTDSSTPTNKSKLYSAPIPITSTTTLKARAFKTGMTDSAVASETYTITPAKMAKPSLSKAGGLYVAGVLIDVSHSDKDAVLRCTTDGSTPSENSSRCSKPTRFETTTVLKARAFRTGATASDTVSARYTIATVLLLHGLNSTASTWNALKGDLERGGATCTEFSFSGKPAVTGCYTYTFLPKTVNNEIWTNGDGSTLADYRTEVNSLVKRITEAASRDIVILVGHSRGGLAARAYLQSLSSTPKYTLGILTIGTPHRGSPLGRIKPWMDEKKFKRSDANRLTGEKLWFVFAPSTGDLATIAATPSPKPGSAIQGLNDQVKALSSCCGLHGEIVSSKVRLGVYSGFDLLENPLWGGSAALPGSFKDMKGYVVKDLSGEWLTEGDGIVPLAAQRFSDLSGFSKASTTVKKTLKGIEHTQETGQAADIRSVLESMLAKVASNYSTTALRAEVRAEPDDFGDVALAAAVDLAASSDSDLIDAYLVALRDGNAARTAAASGLLRSRGTTSDALVEAIALRFASADTDTAVGLLDLLSSCPGLAAVRTLLAIGADQSRPFVRDVAMSILAAPRVRRHASTIPLLRSVAVTAAVRDRALFEHTIAALAADGSERAVAVLLRLLLDAPPESEMFLGVAAALTRVAGAEGVGVLTEALGDPRAVDAYRVAAGEALAAIGEPAATRALLEWSTNAVTPYTSTLAARWLSRARDTQSLDLLRAAARSEDYGENLRRTIQRTIAAHVAE